MGETKTCIDCGSTFEFTDGERLFFANNGLSDPKRCPGCRASRKGLENKQITCSKCGKTFVYPRDLQLFARSYKWDPPTTCLGGCGAEKYTEGYQLSKFETKASGLLGKSSQYFKGHTSQTPIPSQLPSKRTSVSGPKILGIKENPVITNSEIQSFLNSNIPSKHMSSVGKIIFSNDVIMSQFGPSRGYYDEYNKLIMVNNHPLKKDTTLRYINTLSHEIGHAAYSLLTEFQQITWYELSLAAGPVTDRSRDTWYDEMRNHTENFAEAYRLYLHSPNDFFDKSTEIFRIYDFLLDEVFEGKEFL